MMLADPLARTAFLVRSHQQVVAAEVAGTESRSEVMVAREVAQRDRQVRRTPAEPAQRPKELTVAEMLGHPRRVHRSIRVVLVEVAAVRRAPALRAQLPRVVPVVRVARSAGSLPLLHRTFPLVSPAVVPSISPAAVAVVL